MSKQGKLHRWGRFLVPASFAESQRNVGLEVKAGATVAGVSSDEN
jgi:hypothetical protein